MGTSSLTFIYNNDCTKPTDRCCCMYRQFDGYPSGHGLELHEFLVSGQMVNGYGDTKTKQFNGMSCCAAQMVAHFKDEVGGFYLFPTNTKGVRQEYEYHVYFIDEKFLIKVRDPSKLIFEGGLEAFETFCNNPEGE